MLETIGVSSVEELFEAVPKELFLPRPEIDTGISEYEILRLMEKVSQVNTFPNFDSYLGAGAYEHHIPALVGAICSKSEFLTSYTPYQPEISQGMLQVIFEYQSAICTMTDMDAANGSVYDGAAACAEAILMALRIHPNRGRVILAASLHPHYRAVVDQYTRSHDIELVTMPFTASGHIDLNCLESLVDHNTAALLFQSPNFFGVMEPTREAVQIGKRVDAINILCGNPVSYGLFASPGENGADIAVGDSQPFGLALQYGGPYVGYMATREELVRQLPGRVVGETRDSKGRRGFVLTLQAREQHIRREKATSNICTNQALAALASLIGILWYGPEGLKKLALTNYQRSSYLKQELAKIPGIRLLSNATTFNEFVACFDRPLNKVLKVFRKENIEPGLDLTRYYDSLKNSLLVAVTEVKTKEQLDRYIEVARKAANE